jgi:GTP-binding protein HflX
MTEDTMSVVSWLHDEANVDDVEYGDDDVLVDFEARPAIVEQARSRAEDLRAVEGAA